MGAIGDYISSSLLARRTKRERGIGAGNPLRHLESDPRDIQNPISGGGGRRGERCVVVGRKRKKAREGRKISRRNDARCRNAHKLGVLTTVLPRDATGASAQAPFAYSPSFARRGNSQPLFSRLRGRGFVPAMLGASGLVSSPVPPTGTLSCRWIKDEPERGYERATSRYIKAAM